MTIDDLRQSNAVCITAADAAKVLHCDAHMLRVQAHCDPLTLGFPVTICGRRVRIPRIPFLRFLEGGSDE